MTDSTNNSFEEQWQHAFDDAELTPPASVWEKIELGLKPENTLPSKPNSGNKPYYFLGGIMISLLGTFLWFNNTEKGNQVIEKKQIINQKQLVETGLVNHDKAVKVITKKINHKANLSDNVTDVFGGDNNHGKDIENEPFIVSPPTTIEEIPIRTLTDSVEMIEPLAIKSIHSEIENPTINLPADQTPYYVKPTPKPQKKSILKNIKITLGAGVYQ